MAYPTMNAMSELIFYHVYIILPVQYTYYYVIFIRLHRLLMGAGQHEYFSELLRYIESKAKMCHSLLVITY